MSTRGSEARRAILAAAILPFALTRTDYAAGTDPRAGAVSAAEGRLYGHLDRHRVRTELRLQSDSPGRGGISEDEGARLTILDGGGGGNREDGRVVAADRDVRVAIGGGASDEAATAWIRRRTSMPPKPGKQSVEDHQIWRRRMWKAPRLCAGFVEVGADGDGSLPPHGSSSDRVGFPLRTSIPSPRGRRSCSTGSRLGS